MKISEEEFDTFCARTVFMYKIIMHRLLPLVKDYDENSKVEIMRYIGRKNMALTYNMLVKNQEEIKYSLNFKNIKLDTIIKQSELKDLDVKSILKEARAEAGDDEYNFFIFEAKKFIELIEEHKIIDMVFIENDLIAITDDTEERTLIMKF